MTVRVDGDRLLRRLQELSLVGADPRGGVTRLAYSAEDERARQLLGGWLRAAGATPRTDAAGNLIGDTAGSEELGFLASGSHLDTVVQGGHLDGAYGAVAAVEVLATLHDHGIVTRHPLRAVGFANEEGARGTPGMVGSLALAGAPIDLGFVDDEGVALSDRVGLEGVAWSPGEVAGFLELHIEQGPVLEGAATDVGIVTAVTGRANVELEVLGRPAHAGTTPMSARADALVAAAHLVLAIRQLALDGHVRVATAGRLESTPGVRNVVPARATLSAEVRDVDDDRMLDALRRLQASASAIAVETGCEVTVSAGPVVPAVATARELQGCLRDAAAGLGLSTMDLPSGAGHDAQIIARVAPAGLVFVPSSSGISHAPDEATADADLVAGADVLLHALLLADERLDP